MDEKAPHLDSAVNIEGNIVEEEQLYYKGICAACASEEGREKNEE